MVCDVESVNIFQGYFQLAINFLVHIISVCKHVKKKRSQSGLRRKSLSINVNTKWLEFISFVLFLCMYVCGVGPPAHDITFPGLQLDSNVNLGIPELRQESNSMMLQFNKVFFAFITYVETSPEHFLTQLKTVLKMHIGADTIYYNAAPQNLSPLDIKNMKHITAIVDSMSSYCSFFNFELLENAIRLVKFERGIKLMEEYKGMFAKYAKRRVISCPSGIGMRHHDRRCLMVQMDSIYIKCRLEHLVQLKVDISKILEVDPQDLQLEGVINGSVCIIFHLLETTKNIVFPLSPNQVNAIRKLQCKGARILKISCDEYFYDIQGYQSSKLHFII